MELAPGLCQTGGMNDVARLKITLTDTEPPIWRRVDVSTSVTLKGLHSIIQAAMGWENDHLYQFQVGKQTIDGPGFDDPSFSDQRNVTATSVTLGDLIAHRVKRFGYLYDMGDSWEHELRIEKTLSAEATTTYPRFIDGEGRCPPEDVGGLPGFYNFLEAVDDPKHPDHNDLITWYGGSFDASDLDDVAIKKRLARLVPRKKRKAA